jgi:predicted TPR repeat methyltransferase
MASILATGTRGDAIQKKLESVERLIALRDFKAAATALNDTQRLAPNDPRVYVVGAALGHALGNAGAALTAANRALTLAPVWAPAIIAVARAHSALGEHGDALKFAKRAAGLAMQDVTILEMATAVANRALSFADAEQFLRATLTVAADRRDVEQALAVSLQRQSKHEEAIALFTTFIEDNPQDEWALQGRAGSYLSRDEKQKAATDYARLLALQPDNAAYTYFYAVANGETPSQQPASVNAPLFDDYASNYDAHVIGGLAYQAPKRMAQAIRVHFPKLDISVLDLGCGTGLLGVYLGKPQGAMIGVDVSTKMIEQAMKHNIYDRFHTVDLVEALANTPAEQYDVIAACDVFNYVGALGDVIANAYKILRGKGALFFTVESLDGSDAEMMLGNTGRYAHNIKTVESLCRSSGYSDVSFTQIQLRKEEGVAVAGTLVIAQKT